MYTSISTGAGLNIYDKHAVIPWEVVIMLSRSWSSIPSERARSEQTCCYLDMLSSKKSDSAPGVLHEDDVEISGGLYRLVQARRFMETF